MHMTHGHDSKTQRLSDRRTQWSHIHISYFEFLTQSETELKSIQVEWYHLNLKSTFFHSQLKTKLGTCPPLGLISFDGMSICVLGIAFN